MYLGRIFIHGWLVVVELSVSDTNSDKSIEKVPIEREVVVVSSDI